MYLNDKERSYNLKPALSKQTHYHHQTLNVTVFQYLIKTTFESLKLPSRAISSACVVPPPPGLLPLSEVALVRGSVVLRRSARSLHCWYLSAAADQGLSYVGFICPHRLAQVEGVVEHCVFDF